jgi:hypothetical protein
VSFLEERIHDIEQKYTHLVLDVLVLNLTEETFRLILALNNGTTLRVTERWQAEELVRYSYYWLDAEDKLKIGWDNSPHHQQLDNFPHHKHVGEQATMLPSYETILEAVMLIVEEELTSQNHEPHNSSAHT